MEIVISLVIVLIILAILAFAYFKVGSYFYDLALNSKIDKEFVLKDLKNNDDIEEKRKWREEELKWLENVSKDVYITSTCNGNLKLHAYEIEKENKTNVWAIVIHGYVGEASKMTTFIRGFYDSGYNVLAVDLRGHGKSEGNYIGMGIHDRLDVLDWINYILDKDKESKIILFGISMGAATVMMLTGENLPQNVKLAISDCGYTSIWEQFSYKLKQLFRLPPFPVLYAANTICKIKAKYNMKDGSCIKKLENSKTPTLFIHGSKDSFVPFEMLDKVYSACKAEKEKLVIEGAEHGMSIVQNPELYKEKVEKFIEKYL